MKTLNRKLAVAIAALTLSAGALQAQEAQGRVQIGDAEGKAQLERDRITTQADASFKQVMEHNKASKLIGMEVRNNLNENLGEIQDLVLDLHSGKISYVVLSVGGFLGIGEKYVAVPPSAFNVTPGEENLVLNADKAKIQNAPGFAKNNWPDINNPSFGAYWGADLDANRDKGVKGNLEFDKDQKRDQDR